MDNALNAEVNLGYCIVSYTQVDHLVKVVFTDKVLLGQEILMTIQDAIDSLTNSNPYFLLTNMDDKVSPTAFAYDFYADKARAEKVIREAFVLNSPALKLAANFYFKIKKPVILSKVFDREDLATEWLLSSLKDKG